jgi:hypothetical protein
MGKDQPNAPPNKDVGIQDPYGSGGESFVEFGTCPRDKPFNDDDIVMKKLALSKLNSYDANSHGNFFWNFRKFYFILCNFIFSNIYLQLGTELEPRWDYRSAVGKGWIQSNYNSTTLSIIESICNVNIPPTLESGGNNKSYKSNYFLMISLIVIIFIIFYNWKYSIFSYMIFNKNYQYNKIVDKDIVYDEEDLIEIIDRK